MTRPADSGAQPVAGPPQGRDVVVDTNIVLDLFVFEDATCVPLRAALQQGVLRWIATSAMRDELARVLAYPQIVKSLTHHQRSATGVLEHFDALVVLQEVAAKAAVTCKDPDDQKFIDLAVAHRATLLSKDRAVLCMQKRMFALGVAVRSAWA